MAESHRESLAQLRARFADRDPTPEEWDALRQDPRAGTKQLLAGLERRRDKASAWKARAAALSEWRVRLEARGFRAVGGIDEAGRGPLAGPVYAACVVLGPDWDLPGLDDSKKLRPEAREELDARIRATALGYAVAAVGPERIDRINILEATKEAMLAAISACGPVAPDCLVLDALTLEACPLPQHGLVGGDSKVAEIAAASILAKVARDREVVELDRKFPGYGLAEHKGYGTPAHLEAIERLGPSPVHRKSFAPVTRWVLPTREELARRLRRCRDREQLRQVGETIRQASGDLTPAELEDLRSLYRELRETLR